MEKIQVGKIVNVVGLKGEVKVYNYSDSADIYAGTPKMYAGNELLDIENVRMQKNMVILKFAGVDDRDAAEKLRGREVCVTEDDLPELGEGEFYIRDLIGMEVVDEDGTRLGVIKDVIQNTAQDIFEVEKTDGGRFMIPKVDEFITDIDAEKRIVRVRLIEGLMDL